MTALSKRLLWTAKLLLGLGLLAVLILRTDVGALGERLRSAELLWIAAMFVVPHVSILLSTVKWNILLRARGCRVPLRRLYALYLVGTFFNNFLPSMVGGDVVRSYWLGREQRDNAVVVASTFMERFTGLLGMVTLLPLVLLRREIVAAHPALFPLVALAIVGSLAVLAFLFSGIRLRALGKLARPGIAARALSFAKRTREQIRGYRDRRGALAGSYLISIAFYLLTPVTVWLAGRSIGLTMDFGFLVCVMPTVLFIGLIPISVNGLGILEAGYVVLLTLGGISPEEALSIAILIRLRILFTAVLGGVTFLAYRQREDARPAESPTPIS